jgi:hypothetical protein
MVQGSHGNEAGGVICTVPPSIGVGVPCESLEDATFYGGLQAGFPSLLGDDLN